MVEVGHHPPPIRTDPLTASDSRRPFDSHLALRRPFDSHLALRRPFDCLPESKGSVRIGGSQKGPCESEGSQRATGGDQLQYYTMVQQLRGYEACYRCAVLLSWLLVGSKLLLIVGCYLTAKLTANNNRWSIKENVSLLPPCFVRCAALRKLPASLLVFFLQHHSSKERSPAAVLCAVACSKCANHSRRVTY